MGRNVIDNEASLMFLIDGQTGYLKAKGAWIVSHIAALESELAIQLAQRPHGEIQVDFSQIQRLDTSGAWLLLRTRAELEAQGHKVRFLQVKDTFQVLLDEVGRHHPELFKRREAKSVWLRTLESTGEVTLEVIEDIKDLTGTLGSIALNTAAVIAQPRRLRPISIAVQFQKTCMGAVPIVMLMSLLIGGIIAQQGGFYLRQFGADMFVVNLSGVLVLREIGVILTAIMVAGRSGSAFTAELGSMKMREEVDALNVIGLRITEVLVMPRIVALMLAMPLLVFLSDIAALVGAGFVCWAYLDILPNAYFSQLQAAVTVETLFIGIIKAPFMALIIGLVACVEGMKVEGSAESLGSKTTSSVVKSIFMVIFVDGVFAMFFAAIGL
ncbi:ABC transporter permease [Polycladidibacter stylochi]|uniref:ABC transporter permease n=1 Tax=Polycladidibacter stylochi TaxID=1807766 RepID=UPI0009E8AEC5|nr:ABC transporter permease [Pseudovibrio stylochi]